MLRNYLKVALRNLNRHKGYSFISIVCLSMGMAACILIFQYLYSEWSFDRYHEKKDAIYRIGLTRIAESGERDPSALTPYRLALVLAEQIPEIEHITRFRNMSAVVKRDNHLYSEHLLLAEPDALAMFSFDMVAGDPATALSGKHSIVISESAAAKYFGSEDPLGQMLSITTKSAGSLGEFTITGVTADLPRSSTIKFDFLASMVLTEEVLPAMFLDSWGARTTRTYVQLKDGVSATAFEEKIPLALMPYLTEDGPSLDNYEFYLQPLTNVHFDPRFYSRFEVVNNPIYLIILAAIGVVILLMACINYSSLAVGRSSTRLREIGTRKLFGAVRRDLVNQFVGEAAVLCSISLVFAVVLAELFLPVFNGLAQASLTPGMILNGSTLVGLGGLLIVVSLLCGGIPAIYSARFNPIDVFRGFLKLGSGGLYTRSLLVVQFSLSILFVICVLMMSQQLNFMKARDLGFNSEQVVVLKIGGSRGPQIVRQLRSETQSDERVRTISGTSELVGREDTYGYIGLDAEGENVDAYIFKVDEEYLATLEIPLIDGRNFSAEFPSDSVSSLIVNEAFVRKRGWESAIGRQIRVGYPGLENDVGTVVGVVKDYHLLSLHANIEPAVLHMSPYFKPSYAAVRISGADVSGTLDMLRRTWASVAPEAPFEYFFLDQDFDQQYRSEERWSQIVGLAALFAILIAFLGLVGVTTLVLGRRTREIGIRRVLGATAASIVRLVGREFAYIVLAANLLAWPIAYYIMNRWLEGFAYRIDMPWVFFIAAGVLALIVAMAGVSVLSIKTATGRAIDSLKYE